MTELTYIQPAAMPKMAAPLSPAVRADNLLYVSGIPAYDAERRLAVGDFPAQMRQVMENIRMILAEAGAGFDRVVKANVFLTRREDFAEMNRIYAGYFAEGKMPARTTCVVVSLPNPDFLLEIECVAVLG